MLEIKGRKTTAICYANVIEEEAIEQIRRMCDQEFALRNREIPIYQTDFRKMGII